MKVISLIDSNPVYPCFISIALLSASDRLDRPVNSLYRMKHLADAGLIADQLRKRDLR